MRKIKDFFLILSGILMILGTVYLACYNLRPPATIAELYSFDTDTIQSVTFVRDDIRGLPEYVGVPLSVTFTADEPYARAYISDIGTKIWEWQRWKSIDEYPHFDALTDARFNTTVIVTLQNGRTYFIYACSDGNDLLLTDQKSVYDLRAKEKTKDINAPWSIYAIRSIVMEHYAAEPSA